MANLHEHDEHCGCGCDHDDIYITIQTEDDQELHCAIIGVFEVDGIKDKEYIALLPNGSEEALLYQYIELDEDGDSFELVNIESDEEFDMVQDFLMNALEEEYDEDFDEDDEYEFEELEDEE